METENLNLVHKIYLITNTVNGKAYIGKTLKSLKHRWKTHVYNASWGCNYYISKAIRKYGPEAFTIRQIDCTENEQEANELERLYIGILKSSNPEFGYNLTKGGDGVIPNSELRQYQSSIKKGINNPSFGKTGEDSFRYRHDLKNKDIIELYGIGLTPNHIAEQLNTNRNTIIRRLNSLGVDVIKHSGGRSYWKNPKKHTVSAIVPKIIELYESGLSQKQVGQILNISSTCVGYHIKQSGQRLRTPQEAGFNYYRRKRETINVS